MNDDIEVGNRIPYFSAYDQDGDEFSSDDLRGTAFVLYFYPRDNTPGCTKQACSFRDHLEDLEDEGVTVVGVSPDSAASHRKFQEDHDLNFSLLTDEDLELCRAFDVVKEGNKVERTTFLIDEDGYIRWIERNVKVEDHVERVLDALKELDA